MTQRLQNRIAKQDAYAESIRSMRAENEALRAVNAQWKAFLRTLVEWPGRLDEGQIRQMAAEELQAVAAPLPPQPAVLTLGDKVRAAEVIP